MFSSLGSSHLNYRRIYSIEATNESLDAMKDDRLTKQLECSIMNEAVVSTITGIPRGVTWCQRDNSRIKAWM